MFLKENHILGNELCDKMNINIANSSILKKNLEQSGLEEDFIQMGNCVIFNKNSAGLPRNIQQGIWKNEFTDLTNKVPKSYFRTEYGISDANLKKSTIFKGVEKISGKDFFEFTSEFVQKVQGKVLYLIEDKEELKELQEDNLIDGYEQLGKVYLVWY